MIKNNYEYDEKEMIIKSELGDTKINYSKSWKNSIDIFFNINEFDIKNLFLVIQSLISIDIYLPISIYSVTYNNEDTESTVVLSSESINNIKNMKLENFVNWINFRIIKDSRYIKEKNFYCLRIAFHPSMDSDKIKKLKPKFPWNEEIENKWYSYVNIEDILNENKKLKEEILKLKKIITHL